jgi:hypothetical protein
VVRIVDGLPVFEYRVTALHYLFRSDIDGDRFDRARSQVGTIGAFTYALDQGHLRAEPSREFLDTAEAKLAIEPFLRDWEQIAFLAEPEHRIRFECERAEVEEVNPAPGFTFAFAEEAVGVGSAHAVASITRNNGQYPTPDPQFVRTRVTDNLSERLRRARDRETELTSAAYYVLSTLEHEFGGPSELRGVVVTTLAVDRAVLDTLGDLSSRADEDAGRKGKGQGPARAPLTSSELAWIRAAMIRMIRRVGEHASGIPPAKITLADLPQP